MGAKITNYLRLDGNITIPAMAAGDEATATIAVAGAIAGDHVQINLTAGPPANVGIMACWADMDLVKVRFRNTHASTAYVSAVVACTVLVEGMRTSPASLRTSNSLILRAPQCGLSFFDETISASICAGNWLA